MSIVYVDEKIHVAPHKNTHGKVLVVHMVTGEWSMWHHAGGPNGELGVLNSSTSLVVCMTINGR